MVRLPEILILISILSTRWLFATEAFSLLGQLSRVRSLVSTSRSREAMPETVSGLATPSSAVFYRSGNEDQSQFDNKVGTLAVAASMELPTVTHRDFSKTHANIPNSLVLPRRLDPSARFTFRFLGEMEIALGRVSMVAALLLLAVEVTTGQSLPEQIFGVTNQLH